MNVIAVKYCGITFDCTGGMTSDTYIPATQETPAEGPYFVLEEVRIGNQDVSELVQDAGYWDSLEDLAGERYNEEE